MSAAGDSSALVTIIGGSRCDPVTRVCSEAPDDQAPEDEKPDDAGMADKVASGGGDRGS